MKERRLYIVRKAPRREVASFMRHIVTVIYADSKADAVRRAAKDAAFTDEKRTHCAPVAEPLLIGKHYYF